MTNKPTYREMLTLVANLYLRATKNLHLNSYQAFAYAYDETELVRDIDDLLSVVISLTAVFFFADQYGVEFELSDPFTNDVFAELSKSYSLFRTNMLNELNMSEDEVKEFLQDMKRVSEKFLILSVPSQHPNH